MFSLVTALLSISNCLEGFHVYIFLPGRHPNSSACQKGCLQALFAQIATLYKCKSISGMLPINQSLCLEGLLPYRYIMYSVQCTEHKGNGGTYLVNSFTLLGHQMLQVDVLVLFCLR